MKYVRIFDNHFGSLYSIRLSENEPDELTLAFQQWNSPEYLFGFFVQHEADLRRAYPSYSIEEAIARTQQDAYSFEQQLLECCGNGPYDTALDTLFKPLTPNEFLHSAFQRSKARGPMERPGSWLRLYAVRVDDQTYVIAGSAIKLTKTMQEAPHLMQCLAQLKRAQGYLKSIGVVFREDLDHFCEMDE